MVKPIIFISAVSEEFRGLRRDVADVLRKLGYDPHSQESLPTLEGDLRQALREQIDQCEGVIQIIGAGYGAEPPVEDEDFGRCSYTQFEYHYARLKGKKLWTFFAADGDGVGRDKPIAQLDLPGPDADAPDPAAYQAERRELQQRVIARLRFNGQTRHGFSGKTELLNQIYGVRDELKTLREQWEDMQRRIGGISDDTAKIRRFQPRLLLAVVGVALMVGAIFMMAMPKVTCGLPGMSGICKGLGLGRQQELIDGQEAIRASIDQLIEERRARQPSQGFSEPADLEQFRSALLEITETQEGAAALERFQAGEELEALAELDRLRAVQARSVANLALTALDRGKIGVEDVIERFEEVVRLDGSQPWDWHSLGSLYKQAGNLVGMERAARAMLAAGEEDRDRAAALTQLGDVQVAQGDLGGALSSYRRGLEIFERLAEADLSSASAQRDLWVSHFKLFQVSNDSGDSEAAASHLTAAYKILSGMDARGMHLSPQDRGLLDQLREAFESQ